nr:M91 family zinc metallopeptidase [Vibrio ostreicida]
MVRTCRLRGFPGFAAKFDANEHPYFREIMEENLRKLKSVAAGKALLSEIQAARPVVRGSFPPTVNVMCVPTHINFTQSGFKRLVHYDMNYKEHVTGISPSKQAKFAPKGCPFWMAGGSHNAAADPKAATNSFGSVCFMHFSNVQVMTRKGEKADPYVVLAHELIHSLHCLQGTTIDGKDEELWTTGLGKYADNPMSENAFRRQFGVGAIFECVFW